MKIHKVIVDYPYHLNTYIKSGKDFKYTSFNRNLNTTKEGLSTARYIKEQIADSKLLRSHVTIYDKEGRKVFDNREPKQASDN